MSSAATLAYRQARDQLLAQREDYERASAEFRWPDPGPTFNWATDWFDSFAKGNDRDALIVAEENGDTARLTFDEMYRRSHRLAGWLQEQGVHRGDVVILMLGNQVELWDSMLAVMRLGAVIVPTTTALGADDLSSRIARSNARFVLCNVADTATFADVEGGYGQLSVGPATGWQDIREAFDGPLVEQGHPQTGPDDPLFLYFTSGTTSQPKLVEHTQSSYPIGHLTTMYWIGLRPGDIHLNISSPGWAKHAWSCFFAPWIAEATIFVYNYSRFDPQALLREMRAKGVTTFCAPPTVWRMLINADLGSRPLELREVAAAGEPLNPEVIRQVERRWGLVIRDGFGQTETSVQIANTPGHPVKPGSMGRPLPGMPVALVDPVSGEIVSDVGEGELCLDLAARPVGLMARYTDPEGDREAMAGGYYHTGDVAARDEDGYLTFIGRTDDVFKASDYKISPFEIESALIEHPAVLEAAVVPAPDPVRLAVPKAYVAVVEGCAPDQDTARDILRFARERLPAFQRVRRLEFYELPKTISGKIRRVELRNRERQLADAGGSPGEWRDEQFPEIRG